MAATGKRQNWVLGPGIGVGPLLFGMSPAEVAKALQVPGPQSRGGGLYGQEDFPDGVKVFYNAGRLAGIALDAVTGPQVWLADFPLAGSNPGHTQQFLLDHAAEHGNCILFTPDASLAVIGLGILLRDQRVDEARLTRPLFVTDELLESEYYRGRLPLEGVTE
ncbi:hypothetical protein [Kitasatospora viridis]|uniref:Uncharacterized protein n=1 Tax=Kitasatospora viridis TaxID=281105 RepID=A0A561UL11_9ACTN|nr:hypothetical protein [Kitasatospora viridis]TWG00059.1 hypothetical protein FHX73_113925 [Kitasatospora viridis]